ncbi:hypothetical protein AZL_020320 [Azospirillum sp. B510]|uniref:DUF3489 domain-containing protein n=1 Tax=Azospirillum sp. (strain B510) TaxID=137722 RepID=UPI0001C4C362|nr:DUF3489 domain-containing protein [Azospirillum sp. B510]BAI71483.1 hypothetical protein AZL_008450 [Azospirillum sp. B510]BAI72670.1 hypothetical protein AZL_020320 [Azospirillum sp. B510]
MTATFTSKTAASKAARAAGFEDGTFTTVQTEGGWTYQGTETPPTLALVPPAGEQGTEQPPQDDTATGGQADEQPTPAPQGDALKAAPKVTFTGSAFPTVDHAIAWAKCDGFAKNRIKVEPVLGGFLFRPLAEGEKYEAAGSAPRAAGSGPAFPAPGTKKRILIDMVCREGGTTMKELEDAVGWKKCSGTLNELDETFGLELEYRKKGKEGRYYGTFPAAYAPASAEPEQAAA